MIIFYQNNHSVIYAVSSRVHLAKKDLEKLAWLFSDASVLLWDHIEGDFIGPRKEMITPWSTNAVEITQNMAIEGLVRMEELGYISHDEYLAAKDENALEKEFDDAGSMVTISLNFLF